MEPVIIGIGSNLGKRHEMLQKAAVFLEKFSESPLLKSSIWESEPLGPSKYSFLNAAVKLHTSLKPVELLKNLKEFERSIGRDMESRRWSPRLLDLDIITYGNLVIQRETLIIPHPEYTKRLFVLLPMQQLDPDWKDPVSGTNLDTLIETAPDMEIENTNLTW